MKKYLYPVFLAILLISKNTDAKHIFGADLIYKHISGLTYQVTLTLYGDCSGNPSFSNLYHATPELLIQNGNTLYSKYDMQPYGLAGVEVTPVCPSELSNTNCNGGTIPGIARFVFRSTVVLPYTSTNWRFIMDGNLGVYNNNQLNAGRSNLITNITQSSNGSTVMRLEATLNNAVGDNNSADYTTIPTPFFCINFAQQYNQGAIDADGDAMTYSLVPGLVQGGGVVTYYSPFTYNQPIPVQSGTFLFNTTSGQMNFTPNMVSNNLVVTKVTETRNGVVVGTTMREMVFVIQNNCNNNSPGGAINATNVGTINTTGSEITLCYDGITDTLKFNIQASDPDLQHITATVSGTGSLLSAQVNNNNSTNPTISVNFVLPSPFVTGDYTFFVTYQDDGCPISSKQTTAYTIHLVNPLTVSSTITQESCSPGHDATITVSGNSTNPGALQYAFGTNAFQSGNIFSSLNAGNYTVSVKDSKGCVAELPVYIPITIPPVIDSITLHDISCFGEGDGTIQLHVSTSAPSYLATLTPGNIITSSGYFDNLGKGTYSILVVDANACSVSTTATITEPPPIGFLSVSVFPTTCDKMNGKIVATCNLTNGIIYMVKPGIGSNGDGVFQDLPPNTYTVSVRNENNCMHDTVVTVGTIPNNFSAYTTQQDLPCQGAGTEGQAEVFASGGVPPYTYLWTSREVPPSDSKAISNLYYGWYFVTTTDATGCETKDTVYIKPGNCCENIFAPDIFTPNGDGNNDTWHIISSTGIQVEQFKIYNRWGQKVWDAEDRRAQWDGRQHGRIVDNGTYYYMLHYTCLSDGKKYLKKGEINVIN